VLRKIFGPKGEEVAGGWRRLHNEELHDSYNSSNIIRVTKSRRIGWTTHVACVGEVTNAYKILIAKSEGKRASERPRNRW
jgi:hypothetical protein